MTHYEINQTLINHLLLLTGLPLVIYENAPPQAADSYIRLVDIPASTTLETFDYIEEKTGIFQVSVFYERDTGNSDAMLLVDRIIDHFKYKSLDNLTILSASTSSAILSDTHYQKPISITYNYTG